jgi:hypothetical protein
MFHFGSCGSAGSMPYAHNNYHIMQELRTFAVISVILLAFVSLLLLRGESRMRSRLQKRSWHGGGHDQHLDPFRQGLLTRTIETDDNGRLVYKKVFFFWCEDGLLVFNVSPGSKCGTPFVYDICANDWVVYQPPSNPGRCMGYLVETSYVQKWNNNDPMVQILHEGDYPTQIWSSHPSNQGAQTNNQTNSRFGQYYILQPGDFFQ